jgi:CO dehydrogenase maturation factor
LSQFEFIGYIPFDNTLIEADLKGISPFDTDTVAKAHVREMIGKL